MRKYFYLFLSVFCIGLCSMQVSAQEQDTVYETVQKYTNGEFEYSFVDSKSIAITEYVGKKTVVTIPKEIDGMPVTEVSLTNDMITELDVPGTITALKLTNMKHLDAVRFDMTESPYNLRKVRLINCVVKDIALPTDVDSGFEGGFLKVDNIFQDCKVGKLTLAEGTRNLDPWYLHNANTEIDEIVFPDSLTEIGYEAFYEVPIKKLTFGNSATCICEGAFYGNEVLTEVTLPGRLTKLAEGSFANCKSLTSVVIPAVTSCGSAGTYIDGISWPRDRAAYAFQNCDNLTDITIGAGVTSIPKMLAANCPKLSKVEVARTVTKVDAAAFDNFDSLTFYVYANSPAETLMRTRGYNYEKIIIPATQFNLITTSQTLRNGENLKLEAEVFPEDTTDAIVYKVLDTSVAYLVNDGIRTCGVGTTTVQATCGSFKKSFEVTVLNTVTSLKLSRSSLSMEAEQTYRLSASYVPADAVDKTGFIWNSSNPAVASVDQDGVVTAHKKGSANISVRLKDRNIQASITVKVVNNIYDIDSVSKFESSHPINASTKDIWRYCVDGAEKLKVTFSENTDVPGNNDGIIIYDGNRKEIGRYTGTELAGKTIEVDGDTVMVQLVATHDYKLWGYAVTDVEAVFVGPQIVTQPQASTVFAGETVNFAVAARGTGLTYRWEKSTDGGKTWVNSASAGAKTSTLTMPTKLSYNGYQFRCVVTDKDGYQKTTRPVTITVKRVFIINEQPASATVAAGQSVVFSTKVAGEGLKYQWKKSTDGGTTWVNSASTGARTDTLTMAAKANFDGYQFKCVVTDIDGTVLESNAAVLTVKPNMVILEQPYSYSTYVGTTIEYKVLIYGEGLTYQWKKSTDGGVTWANSASTGAKTDTLSITVKPNFDGYQFKCVIKDKNGKTVTSNAVGLTVMKRPGDVAITTHPSDVFGTVGSTVTFCVGTTGEGLTYQWKKSTDGGKTWVNSASAGAKSDTLTMTAKSSFNGLKFKCIVTDQYGTSVSSNEAWLIVR